MSHVGFSDHLKLPRAAGALEEQELLARGREIFGDGLIAVILTGSHQQLSDRERHLSLRNDASRIALAAAVDIAEELLELEAKPTVQAWFVGKNELLGDRAPALVIKTNSSAVHAAARQFAAYG